MRILFVLVLFVLTSCSWVLRQTEKESRPGGRLLRDIQSSDRRKKNLCTITINSQEETRAFKNHLSEFNHIELTPADQTQTQWFEEACKSGVQCDVLIISGHFGGSFFGKDSKLTLGSQEMEAKACQNSCDGILKNPKEVYLFGCNTLAGKTKDHRSPQEYIQVLVRDGFSHSEAQTLAAIRYSPFGNSFYDKMTRTFTGVPKIYGFDSVGPSGKNIEKSLKSYLNQIGNYEDHLSRIDSSSTNTMWSKTMSSFAQTQAKGISLEKLNQSFACRLQDPATPNTTKLHAIDKVFGDETLLLNNIEYLDYYFERGGFYNQWRTLSKAESEFESMMKYHLMANETAKSQVSKYLVKELPGMLSLQVSLLNTGKYVGWWTQEYYDQKIRDLFGDFKKGISIEYADVLCSRSIKIPGLQRNHFKSGVFGVGEYLAFICLKPKDVNISNQIAKELDRSRTKSLLLQALIEIGESSIVVEKALVNYAAQIKNPVKIEAEELTSWMGVMLKLGVKCSNCSHVVNYLLQKKINKVEDDYFDSSRYALIYQLRSPDPSDEIITMALQRVFYEGDPMRSSDAAEIRFELETDHKYCKHLELIQTYENQFVKDSNNNYVVRKTSENFFDSKAVGSRDELLISSQLKKKCK